MTRTRSEVAGLPGGRIGGWPEWRVAGWTVPGCRVACAEDGVAPGGGRVADLGDGVSR
jgi:hypothetical protein